MQTELVAVLRVGLDLNFCASNIRVFLFCRVIEFLSGIEYAGFAVKLNLDCSLRHSHALTIKNCRHEQLYRRKVFFNTAHLRIESSFVTVVLFLLTAHTVTEIADFSAACISLRGQLQIQVLNGAVAVGNIGFKPLGLDPVKMLAMLLTASFFCLSRSAFASAASRLTPSVSLFAVSVSFLHAFFSAVSSRFWATREELLPDKISFSDRHDRHMKMRYLLVHVQVCAHYVGSPNVPPYR